MPNFESPLNNTSFHNKSLMLKTQSIGSTALERIQTQGIIGSIHSVFQRVINVTVLDNKLISLVGDEIGDGPLNIVVNIPENINFLKIGINKGDWITKADELIVVGENVMSISTQGAHLWEPKKKFNLSLQPLDAIIENVEIIKQVSTISTDLVSLSELILFTSSNGLEDIKTKKIGAFSKLALPHIISMLKAIKGGNLHKIKQITKNLVGLGPGLTPSADDMLLGLMVSMLYFSENFIHTSIDVKKINKEIISVTSGQTTIISQEFLKEASVGKVNEPVASLIKNLLTTKQGEVKNSVRKVLDFGSSSGADTVFGIILGSYLMLNDILLSSSS